MNNSGIRTGGRTRGVLGHTFLKNFDFGILTSTYAEFNAVHENDLGFLVWAFWRA